MKVFLASARGTPDSVLAEPEVRITEALKLSGFDPKVIRAKDEWDASFPRMGGWDAWTTHIAQGVDYTDRKPLFDLIVCLDETVGKATAQIAQKALEVRKNVLLYHEKQFFRVLRVDLVDSDNWQSGWRLTIDP